VLVCSERKVLLAVGGWFVLREKYCWLVADKPSEQAEWLLLTVLPYVYMFISSSIAYFPNKLRR
jgi:hypothetical protein